jgi:hypothetical protein
MIMDVEGKILWKSEEASELHTTVKISEFPSGIYLLKAGNEVQRFVKQ